MSALERTIAPRSPKAMSRGSAAFEMRVGGDRSIALPSRCRPSRAASARSCCSPIPRREALADARKLQLALGRHDAARAARRRASRRGGRRAGSPSRWPGSTTPPDGSPSGEHVQVQVRGSDELARLATSFNEMVGKIAEREQRITQLAFNDVLTGLPNRTMFQQQLEHLFRASEGSGGLFALHCLDLDQFKVINDTLGHPAGDALLVEAGAAPSPRRARTFRGAAGRRRVRRPADGRRATATRSTGWRATSSRRWRGRSIIDGNELVPSTSIGIAIAPDDGGDGGTLLRNADLALYRAKEAGRGTYAFFEESLNERAQERRQLETDLRLALERGEFELYYQPLFDLEQNRICSFEALMRWNHPTRGLDLAGRVHSGRRGHRPDRADRRLGDPRSLRAGGALARANPGRGQRLAGAVPPRRAARDHPARARRHRPRARPAGGGDHRIHLPRRQRGDAASCFTRCARSGSASRSTISERAIRH